MTIQAKEYVGGAALTHLSSGITSSDATIPLVDGSSYPTGGTAPFVVCIDRGTASEEKVLVNTRSSSTLTVNTRGYDGTTASSHAVGAEVEHVLDAVSMTDANKAAAQTVAKITTVGDLLVGTGTETMKRLGRGSALQALGVNAGGTDLAYLDTATSVLTTQGDTLYAAGANTPARLAKGTSLQYYRMNAGGTTPEWATLGTFVATASFYTVHTWAIGGAIAVPSGDTNFINPMFVGENSTETVVLDKVRYIINSGTSVTFKMQVNGADATGFTGISCTTSAGVTDPTNVALADGDRLAPVVTAVSGSPVNLSITAVLLHTVTLA